MKSIIMGCLCVAAFSTMLQSLPGRGDQGQYWKATETGAFELQAPAARESAKDSPAKTTQQWPDDKPNVPATTSPIMQVPLPTYEYDEVTVCDPKTRTCTKVRVPRHSPTSIATVVTDAQGRKYCFCEPGTEAACRAACGPDCICIPRTPQGPMNAGQATCNCSCSCPGCTCNRSSNQATAATTYYSGRQGRFGNGGVFRGGILRAIFRCRRCG